MLTQAIQANSGPAKIGHAEATKVAQQFEAIFVQEIVSKMREQSNMLGDDSMFGSGPGANTYADWFDKYMSEHMSKSGRVGVADAIVSQLDRLHQLDDSEQPKESLDATV